MPQKTQGFFYYDIISPFTYLFLRQRAVLADRLHLIPKPIFFPGLLRLQDNRGPAEVSEKRVHTYDFCIWSAKKHGIPMKFPARHPFPSVAAQRLFLQQNADWEMLDQAFDFVWVQGRDPDLEWPTFCASMGLPSDTSRPDSAEIKGRLAQETEQAARQGIFGVPTLVVHQRVFWGCDSIPWILDYLDDPNMFEQPDFQRLRVIENPLKTNQSNV
ncbi:MAG: disulfide bond formation protein DsbA [Betaproteobacteria bacterium]|jgi:2-hydroxychromene-2-carboxylate isomerase|nr:disulfide bond formation protein DsbA [Betaproteobacteria bacterium]